MFLNRADFDVIIILYFSNADPLKTCVMEYKYFFFKFDMINVLFLFENLNTSAYVNKQYSKT